MREGPLARLGRSSVLGLALLGLLWAPPSARLLAQPAPASLVADRIDYDAETETLTASGAVEILYEGRVLHAAGIVYDARNEEIRAQGPITLADPSGSVILADSGALSSDLQTGLVQGARLLIADQLQMAASEIGRKDGRFTSLYQTVASSCTICEGDATPVWALRAARVTLDDLEHRIYFEDATVEVLGLPVGYLPRMSIPDPRVRRASGFLLPGFSQSDIYGFGFKLPYYRVLGPSADATVTPFLTSKGAQIIEGEYRRRFANGGFDLAGVLALTSGLDSSAGRGALTATGDFALFSGFIADFDINLVSDQSFLLQYDYSDADRLTSEARVLRTRENDFMQLGMIGFQSLREDEDTENIPFILPDFTYRQLVEMPGIGGRLGLDLDTLGVWRQTGVNMLRAGGGADWRRDWTLAHGLLVNAVAATEFDFYRVWDDPATPERVIGRATPIVSTELRWPLLRTTGRAAHVIEPIAQIVYSDIIGETDNPNEDSQLPEFDTTNLFVLNRYPGRDRYETGLRANLGISYTRYDPSGWSLGLTAGRVLRADGDTSFPEDSGLDGRWSDYVTSVALTTAWGLTLSDQALFGDDFLFRRNEFAVVYDSDRADFAASYVYFAEDDTNEVLGPQPETNEFSIDARYRVHPNWEVRGLWRYDIASDSNLRAGAGITYGTQCAEFDLSVSRRFTSSDNVPPSTSIGFNVSLAGLGDSEDRSWPARVCLG